VSLINLGSANVKTIVIGIALIALAFYAAMEVTSGEWSLEKRSARQSPAPIIKGPNYNEVGADDSKARDVYSYPSFLGNRLFVDCGRGCEQEIGRDGVMLSKSVSLARDSEDPVCSGSVYNPEDIDRDFARNEIRAEAHYTMQCWRIGGRIAEIETNAFGGARFQLYGPTGVSIQCHVADAYMGQFINLNPGDPVVIKGRGPSRIIGDVVFRACKL
jgi:translation initiation factor IF-1